MLRLVLTGAPALRLGPPACAPDLVTSEDPNPTLSRCCPPPVSPSLIPRIPRPHLLESWSEACSAIFLDLLDKPLFAANPSVPWAVAPDSMSGKRTCFGDKVRPGGGADGEAQRRGRLDRCGLPRLWLSIVSSHCC